MGILVDKRLGHKDLGGCAIATLDGAGLNKCLLDRMELPTRGQCLNRRYLVVLDLCSLQLTATGRLTIKQNGARSTVRRTSSRVSDRLTSRLLFSPFTVSVMETVSFSLIFCLPMETCLKRALG